MPEPKPIRFRVVIEMGLCQYATLVCYAERLGIPWRTLRQRAPLARWAWRQAIIRMREEFPDLEFVDRIDALRSLMRFKVIDNKRRKLKATPEQIESIRAELLTREHVFAGKERRARKKPSTPPPNEEPQMKRQTSKWTEPPTHVAQSKSDALVVAPGQTVTLPPAADTEALARFELATNLLKQVEFGGRIPGRRCPCCQMVNRHTVNCQMAETLKVLGL
jgi:hypothetical protein